MPDARSRISDPLRVAVIGVGVTKFGKHDRTSAELFAAAAADALADAEMPAVAVQYRGAQ